MKEKRNWKGRNEITKKEKNYFNFPVTLWVREGNKRAVTPL